MHQRPDNSNSNNDNNNNSTSSGAQQAGLVPGQGQAADICSRLEAMDVQNASGVAPTPTRPPAPVPGAATGDVMGDSGEEEPESSSLGPEERRQLTVAAMSPEDIVLCVDVGPEMGSEWAGAGPGGSATSRMRVVQAALSGFVRRKASFNQRHRFALCTLGDGVTVVRPLSQDIRGVLEAIDRLQALNPPESPPNNDEEDEEPPFDFTELLVCIAERFPPPTSAATISRRLVYPGAGAGATAQIRPVVRAVVVYGRSYTCPLVPMTEEAKHPLLSHGRFFLDCIYVHRKPSEEGVVCQEAFDLIAGMETFGGGSHSYFLECGHNLQRFNSSMASLLAHPVQRDYQEAFFEKLASGGAGGHAETAAGGGGGGPSGGGGASQGSRIPRPSSAGSNTSPPATGAALA